MEKSVAQFTNRGMYQDVSISKATNEFAFENRNIRITALDNHTLFSVSNVRGEVYVKDESDENVILTGTYLGHAILNDVIVFFSHSNSTSTDHIYKIQFNNDKATVEQLYSGDLDFDNNHLIQTLPYYESEDVQKVYWVDGKNQPRVINIMNVKYSTNNNTQFDFIPTITTTPKITVEKQYSGLGLFPAGVIQYFVSYYNKYGSETPILAATPIYYINNNDRGASSEDILTCSFDITISNLDTSFDYIKVYSLKRTSYNNEVQCNLIKDISITGTELHLIDTNTNQFTEDPTKLYFLGGGNFIAETIAAKDNTLFLGNITPKESGDIFTTLKEEINKTIVDVSINDTIIKESSLLSFTNKYLSEINISGYYINDTQSKSSSNLFKTFKRGEIYRFALQFQDTKGIWSNPIWAGDLLCNISPNKYLNEDSNTIQYIVADVQCTLTDTIKTICSGTYLNYRVLIADTTNSQSIVAQGVVCPTVFNYAERSKNQIFSKPSWIMRPRNGNAEWRHLGSVGSEIQSQDSNIGPFTNNYYVNSDGVSVEDVVYDSIILTITIYNNHDARVCVYNADSGNIKVNKLVKDYTIKSVTWKTTYSEINNFFSDYSSNFSNLLTEEDFISVAKPGKNKKEVTTPDGWVLYNINAPKIKRCIYKEINKDNNKFTTKSDLTFEYKKNNYYVDNSIVTFHSPDIKNVVNNSDLNFRIVGLVPITASYSDINGTLKNKGLSSEGSFHKEGILNISNKTILSDLPKTLTYGDLYSDYGWTVLDKDDDNKQYIPNSTFENYLIYLWHKQGSIVGQNENTYLNSELNTIDTVYAELKSKTFGTQLFSLYTKYFNSTKYWQPTAISKVQVVEGDALNTTKINMYRIGSEGNYLYGSYKIYSPLEDKLLAHTEPYYVKELKQYDPISIKYKTTKHAVFGLLDSVSKVKILPKLTQEDSSEKESDIYEYLDNKKPNYSWISENAKPLGGHNALIIPSWMVEQDSGHYVSNKTIVWSDIYNYLKNKDNHYKGFPLGKIRKGMLIMLVNTGTNRLDKRVNITDCTVELVCQLTSLAGATANLYYKGDSNFPNGGIYDLYGILDDNIAFNITYGLGIIDSDGSISYVEDGLYYETDSYISGESADNYPYLYLAELYRTIPYNSLYGGYDENALEQIQWIPSTTEYSINETARNAEGDTYYQRWDCLKSYPYTEEDINKIVNITSFMVETRQNLEGRYDRNIGTTNILNLRPTNFNLFNNVYSQPNNFFTYNILDEKFINKHLKNQIVWSLVKTPTADVDNWTMITTNSALNIDGSYGAINKLMCYNDSILAFQDRGISVINFNNRTALSTEGGLPVEIANSGKVDGYRMLFSTSGCTDKSLSILTNAGLYYVDIYNNALYMFNGEGLSNISEKGMSVWFKNNTKNIKRLLYDSVTSDLYIITSDDCLVYNEKLQIFTTFLDSVGSSHKAMFGVKGNSFIVSSTNNIHLYQMHAGGYASNYKMVYRVNPDPLMDKVFTNIEYLSELYDSTGNNINKSPFESLEVENEYQYGKTLISNTKYPMNRRKFRIWRMDLPRDAKSTWGLDRIRSPWITLTLNGKNTGERLEFHNLNVIYYK